MTAAAKPTSLFANLMAYGTSEVASKVSRLLVVIVVARSLGLAEIGLAASALAAGDILKSLTENGVGQKIIAARDDELEATCQTAHRIFWAWCLGLFAFQLAIGALLALSGAGWLLFALIALLAGEYLFMPAGLVQAALAMRAGKLKQTAGIAGTQVVGANLISAVLVLVWPSALALVLPRLLSAPIWLVAMRRLHPWTPAKSVDAAPLRPFFDYGWAVLGVELVKALRLQADKLLVGALLGAEALGLYFMAFNAGLSISTSFSVAFSTVLFPYLSQTANKALALRHSIVLSLALITPAVVLQAALAPYYVPVLFGEGWGGVSNIVSILCLVAIPTTLWAAASGWLRSQMRPDIEFGVTVGLTAALMVNTVVLAPFGLEAIAWGYLVTGTALMLAGSIPALRVAFAKEPEFV